MKFIFLVDTLGRLQQQCWVPLVANQFPAQSPFAPLQEQQSALKIPELKSPQRTKSLKKNREVKFQKLMKKVS